MEKPGLYLQSAWDKLTNEEKKDIYLHEIISSQKTPHYLAGLIEEAETTIDNKITIAEKIIKGEMLTECEKKSIGLNTADYYD